MVNNENRDELLKLALTHLNPAEGYETNGLIPFNAQQFNEFSLAYHHDQMGSAGLWGFKDVNNNVVCEPKYLFEPIVCGDTYIVCIGSGWKHTDDLSDGKIWSEIQKWGLVDKKQKTLIPFDYDELECINFEWVDDNNTKGDIFVGRKYLEDNSEFYMECEIINNKNEKLIENKYSDVDYRIEYNQLVVYKNRERSADSSTKGFAGVYDFNLNKEIIHPNKYRQIEIVDYNLFLVSDDVDNYYNATLINENDQIIGKENEWDSVSKRFESPKDYIYCGKTMDGKYYRFNIKNNKIVDLIEISAEDYLK